MFRLDETDPVARRLHFVDRKVVETAQVVVDGEIALLACDPLFGLFGYRLAPLRRFSEAARKTDEFVPAFSQSLDSAFGARARVHLHAQPFRDFVVAFQRRMRDLGNLADLVQVPVESVRLKREYLFDLVSDIRNIKGLVGDFVAVARIPFGVRVVGDDHVNAEQAHQRHRIPLQEIPVALSAFVFEDGYDRDFLAGEPQGVVNPRVWVRPRAFRRHPPADGGGAVRARV